MPLVVLNQKHSSKVMIPADDYFLLLRDQYLVEICYILREVSITVWHNVLSLCLLRAVSYIVDEISVLCQQVFMLVTSV
jgi:hypothetical protein